MLKIWIWIWIWVQLYNLVPSGSPDTHIKILDAKIRGLSYENPIEFGQDFAYDDLLENSNIGYFSDLNLKACESCHLNPDFPDLVR